MGKYKLTSEGKLPISISCDPAVIAIVCGALDGCNKEVPTAPTVPTTTGLITGGNTGVVATI